MRRMIKPGEYRQKIQFLKKGDARDKYGEPIESWVPFNVRLIPAKLQPVLGNEYFTALTTETKVESKIECRYIPGITNEMRIKHGADIYEILSVIDVDTAHVQWLIYVKLVR